MFTAENMLQSESRGLYSILLLDFFNIYFAVFLGVSILGNKNAKSTLD